VKQQGMSVIGAVSVALLLIVALVAGISLVAMHSVATSASTMPSSGYVESQLSTTAHAVIPADLVSYDSDAPSFQACPCPGGSDSLPGMSECTPLVSLGAVTVVAQLRTECAAITPLLPRTVQSACVVVQSTAPSLHALSISRT
jgi:hypothetical protein